MSTTTLIHSPGRRALSPWRSPSGWRAIALIILAYSITFGSLAATLRREYGFPLDDSYIYEVMARNFAQAGVLGFTLGVPSSGATSLLWVCIETANFKFFHLDPIIFNLVLSWTLLVMIGALLFAIAERDGMPPQDSLVLAMAPALSGNFLWLGLVGMEHLLLVTLLLAAVYFWFDGTRENLRSALLAGACFGCLAITRPDAMLFGLLLLLGRRQAHRTMREVLLASAVWISFAAISVGSNWHIARSLMPATFKGRAWLYFHESGGAHSFRSVLGFLVSCAIRPSMDFSLWRARTINHAFFLFLIVLLLDVLACLGAFWLLRRRFTRINALCLLALFHFCTYLVKFPAEGHGGRYQPLNLLLLLPCLFFGLRALLYKTLGKTKIAGIVAAASLLLAGTASLRTWRTVTIDGTSHINNTHGRAAEWLLHNTDVNTRVAVFDIGKIGYASNRYVLDLGGLIDPVYDSYLASGRVPSYLDNQRVDLLVLPSGPFARDLGLSQLDPALAEFCSPGNVWEPGWQYTGNAEECQTIYRNRNSTRTNQRGTNPY